MAYTGFVVEYPEDIPLNDLQLAEQWYNERKEAVRWCLVLPDYQDGEVLGTLLEVQYLNGQQDVYQATATGFELWINLTLDGNYYPTNE